MKAAIVLLAFVALAQARTLKQERALAKAGENPYVVSLRIADSISGYLSSCTGNLVNNRWVLTVASCLDNQRFVWLRFGAENIIYPELVLESSVIRIHPAYNPVDNNVALINLNRNVEYTANISPIQLQLSASFQVPTSARYCSFTDQGLQNCVTTSLISGLSDVITGSSDQGRALPDDVGAALVDENQVAFAVLIESPPLTAGYSARYLRLTRYVDWINTEISA